MWVSGLVRCIVRVWLCCFMQKTAYEMRISDWSSDVCSSDLLSASVARGRAARRTGAPGPADRHGGHHRQLGRASCRERVCQYVQISVVAGTSKQQEHTTLLYQHTSTSTSTRLRPYLRSYVPSVQLNYLYPILPLQLNT